MDSAPLVAESRRNPRLRLAAMYTLLRVRRKGEHRFNATGYIYDISRSGMRFELDDPIAPGTQIEVRAMLPGSNHVVFEAEGTVVRLHEEHELPPVRMGMAFDEFVTSDDAQRLDHYLQHNGIHAAA